MLHSTTFGILMLAAAASVSGDTPLTESELTEMATQLRSFTPRDKFDSLPTPPSVAGKQFSVVISPLERGPDNAICSGHPSWGFRPEKGHFEVDAGNGDKMKSSFKGPLGPLFPSDVQREPGFIRFVSFTCSKTKEQPYVTTNGFGAQVRVEKSTDVVTAIAYDRTRKLPVWKDYWTTAITGNAARQLATNVRVRISGVLGDWSPGISLMCGVSRHHPTMTLPIDRTLDICMFNGRIDKFEVLNVATGELLYSASPPPEKKRR